MSPTISLQVDEPWVKRLREISERRPLCLGIETINICDARCTFCGYAKMQRPKVILDPEVFQKAVRDYVDMGGGAIRLTPTAGENLLDPHLLDRLRILRSEPLVGQIYFVTNGIGWDRYSPSEQKLILESIDWLGFSLGGVDAESYREMYKVDRFEKVRAAIHTACDIKKRHGLPLELHLSFRASRPIEELLADPRMGEFRRPEVDEINGGNRFLNWGGMIGAADLPPESRRTTLAGFRKPPRSGPPSRPAGQHSFEHSVRFRHSAIDGLSTVRFQFTCFSLSSALISRTTETHGAHTMSYCDVAPGHPFHGPYHETEYGFPIQDDSALFERLVLEINQAGLSWLTILKKRRAFWRAFEGFDIDRVAQYGAGERSRLLADAGIIRNRLKIDATLENARRLCRIRDDYGAFSVWLDAHHPLGKDDWVRLFKENFRFVGGEIVGEFLMSTGYLPGAHSPDCPVQARIAGQSPPWMSG